MELGNELRKAREAAGLNRSDVSRRIYIRESYLAALETENYRAIPGSLYIKGMLRNYADFLGLSGEAMVDYWSERYDAYARPRAETRRGHLHGKVYLADERRVRNLGRKAPRRRKRRPWTPLERGIIAGGIGILLALSWWLFWL
ncbi:MAG: helix-turn-helix domain-containing protein [Veillonellaceae bacterium]|nr:helix-turn-helix domain-containing protein [Veillonellaceae bacterium]